MEWLALILGIIIGSFVTAKYLTSRTKKMMKKRGAALRAITHYQWDTNEQNDAVVVTRIALEGLQYDE